MLAIKKRHKAVKAITAGSIAFAVGLTGASAYIDRSQQHENLTFSKEQNTQSTPQPTPAAAQATASDVQGASSGNGTAMPQATGSMRALAPAPSVVSSAPTTPTLEPGRGAGAPPAGNGTTTSPTTTDPAGTVTDSCLLQNCATSTIQNATNELLGQ